MSRKLAHKDDFSQILQRTLLSVLRRGELHMMLAELPFRLSEGMHAVPVSKPLLNLKQSRRSFGNVIEWPERGMQAKPNPFLAFVLDGHVDLSVGVVQGAKFNQPVKTVWGVYEVRLPPSSVLVYPAHTPTTDGMRPHWYDSKEKQHDSTILWVDIMPEGALLHTCSTERGNHSLGPYQFTFDAGLSVFTDALVEELQRVSANTATVELRNDLAQSLMEILLLRILCCLTEQDLHEVSPDVVTRVTNDNGQFGKSTQSPVVERACKYIHGRLNHRLSVGKIASQAFVSPAQLNRFFRSELGRSVMDYVSEQRLGKAKSLLENTSLPINVISESIGIPNPVYFSRMFREKTGATPVQYRRNHLEILKLISAAKDD